MVIMPDPGIRSIAAEAIRQAGPRSCIVQAGFSFGMSNLKALSESAPTAVADFHNDNAVDGADFLALRSASAETPGSNTSPELIVDTTGYITAADEIFHQLGMQSHPLPRPESIMMEWGSSTDGLMSPFNQAESLVAENSTEPGLDAAALDLTAANHDLQILQGGESPDIYLSGGWRDAPKPTGYGGGPPILAGKRKDAENIEFKNESMATSSSESGDQVLDLATGEVYEFPPGTLGEPAPPETPEPPKEGGGFWGKIFGGGGGGNGGGKKDKKDNDK
jgi:hypothetical protein